MTISNKQIQALKAAAEKAIEASERLASYPEEIIDISAHQGEQIDEDIKSLNEYERQAAPSVTLSLLAEREADKALIAKLQGANAAQDDHINQQADRIDYLEKTNAGLGKRLCSLDARTLTVNFPDSDEFDSPDMAIHAIARCVESVKSACAAAGITLVVGE